MLRLPAPVSGMAIAPAVDAAVAAGGGGDELEALRPDTAPVGVLVDDVGVLVADTVAVTVVGTVIVDVTVVV